MVSYGSSTFILAEGLKVPIKTLQVPIKRDNEDLLLHDEAIHQSKQPWVNLGQHVLGVSYHPAALVITLRG